MVEGTPAEEGPGSKDKEGKGSAMSEVGLSESEPESPGPRGDEAAPEEPPPPPLPYTTAAEFGFTTENTAVFLGLRCLADIELFVTVLRLDLDNAEEVGVVDIFCRCVLGYEKKYQESAFEATLFTLQQCAHNTWKQVKAEFDRRVEVLNSIRRAPQQAGETRPFVRETLGSARGSTHGDPILQEGLDPEYKLTRNEVDAWMNSNKKKFYLLPLQVASARVDKA